MSLSDVGFLGALGVLGAVGDVGVFFLPLVT